MNKLSYRRKARLIEKLAFETQYYSLGKGGKLYSNFGGNRPSTMTMAMASGLKPQKSKFLENYWEARKEVTDKGERDRAIEILMKKNRGVFGKPLWGSKRKTYSQLEKLKEQDK